VRGYRVLVVAVAAAAAGPGALLAQQPDGIPFPYPRFAANADSVDQVEEALSFGDRYRDLCFRWALGEDANIAWAVEYAREAKGWYRRAEDLEPQNAYAELSTGYVSMIMGRISAGKAQRREYAQARASYGLALERRPGYADAHRYLGELEALEENWAAAEQHFRLLLDSKIEDSHTHAWLGYVLYRQGKKALAEEHWQKARDYGRPAVCAEYARDRLE
jgi:tetratricopeptide (TPR) repeat protein